MSLGLALTLVVMSVILLGAALYTFTNINNIKTGKKSESKSQNN